jgi:hypothetical protein
LIALAEDAARVKVLVASVMQPKAV